MSLILVIAPLKISINVHAWVLSLLLRSSFVISVIPNTSWEQFSRVTVSSRAPVVSSSKVSMMVEIICYIDPLSGTTASSFSLKTGRGTVLGSDLEVVWGPEPISNWDISQLSSQLCWCRSFPYSVSRLPCPLARAHVTGCSLLGWRQLYGLRYCKLTKTLQASQCMRGLEAKSISVDLSV